MTDQSKEAARLTPGVSKRDHLRGSAAAPMTLVQFGDYACPVCIEAHPVVRQLTEAAEGRLRFVYRHYPLASALSRRAAEVAEIAAARAEEDVRPRAFWKIHDLLSAMNGDLSEPDVFAAAEAATGVSEEQIREDLDRGTFAERVEEDIESAEESGARGTPTFFVGEERYDRTISAEGMLERLNIGSRQKSALARVYMKRLDDILGRSGLF